MEQPMLLRAATHERVLPTYKGGGSEPLALRLFQIWRSSQNGWVYDPNGLSPCLSAGQHGGVEPKIIEFNEK